MGERYRLLGGYRGGSDMRVGSLVKHIEWDYIGVVLQQGVSCGTWQSDRWLIHYDNGVVKQRWCSECELEVLCV